MGETGLRASFNMGHISSLFILVFLVVKNICFLQNMNGHPKKCWYASGFSNLGSNTTQEKSPLLFFSVSINVAFLCSGFLTSFFSLFFLKIATIFTLPRFFTILVLKFQQVNLAVF